MINFAIIGCGRIGNRHAFHINNLAKLKAVCDIDKSKSKELSKTYNCNSYESIDDLIKNERKVDVISICTPNGLHAEQTIKSLNSKFHVLCEKPMALSSYDCGEMIKASERNNKRLFIVKQNRFNPPVKELKKIVENNILGKILNVQLNCFWNRNNDYYKNSWKGTLEMDGGILFTQFSHFIDLLYWINGDVEKVSGFKSNFINKNIIEFEDTGVVNLFFKNGSIGSINYTINSFGKNMEGSLTLFGEKGSIKVGGKYLNELEYQNIDSYKIKNLSKGNPPNNYGDYVGSMSNHDMVYKNLIDVLTKNKSITTNSFEGMKTVEIIEKIYKNSEII